MNEVATEYDQTSDIVGKLKPGDVIITSKRGINLGSIPIRFANFSRHGYRKRIWTHAAFNVGGGKVVEAFPKGIVKRDLKTAYLDKPFDIICLRRKGIAATDFMEGTGGSAMRMLVPDIRQDAYERIVSFIRIQP